MPMQIVKGVDLELSKCDFCGMTIENIKFVFIRGKHNVNVEFCTLCATIIRDDINRVIGYKANHLINY